MFYHYHFTNNYQFKMAFNKVMFVTSLYILLFTLVLPGKCVGYTNWDEYWQAYEASSYFPRLYPYKEEFDDAAQITGFDAKINYKIPYFGRIYNGAYVSLYGNVELFKDIPPNPGYRARVKWPNENYPDEPDPPLLSVYYASWAIYSSDTGRMFWRILDPMSDKTDITEGMLSVISQSVRDHIVGGDHFHATYGLIVTWDAMFFIGCSVEPNCPRNTVQIALVTDEEHTYAVYHYYNLTWIGSGREWCNPATGLKDSEHENCVPAQAGFNTGEGRHFEALPHSNEEEVINLDKMSSTNVQGRFVYGLSGFVPSRGGCTNDTEIDPAMWPLQVYPNYISMYGGSEVYFSGPCILPGSNVMCRFGDREVPGKAVPDTMSKGMCISPMMDNVGWTDICVSVNGGNNYAHCTDIHVVPKYYLWPEIYLYNTHGEWYTRGETTLMLKWNPDSLQCFHEDIQNSGVYNDTGPSELLININLLGYMEEPNANGTMEGKWHYLHTFESGIENSGEYSFNTPDHECTVDCGYERPIVGVIQVEVLPEEDEPTKTIYSEAVPLGWFLNTAMTEIHGDTWSDNVCIDWHNQDKTDTTWMNELEPCPMTRGQAYTDIGHFIYPEVPCEPESPCPMIPRPEPHIECAHAIPPSSSRYGSVSTCCYQNDGDSSLMYGSDHPMGSSASRASPYISKGYYDSKVTPYMSHWARDRLPYIMCCNWTNNEQLCMEQYMALRPTLQFNEYQTSGYASIFGDPHYFTFDGTEYLFNGHGEFWLLRVKEFLDPGTKYDNFNLQGRFLPPIDPAGAINATVLAGVAMQEGDSQDQENPKIEIQLNDADAPTKLLVLVNGAVKNFDSPGLMYQEFYSTDKTRRTIVQNNDPLDENHQRNFTIIFENDVAVQVANQNGFLHTIVVVPPKYVGVTEGLFGLWNDNPDDDLISSGGAPISPDQSTEYIHTNFGQTWEIMETDSRFTYRGKANWDYYSNRDFMPNFEEPVGDVGNITDAEVDAFCGTNSVCRYDYKTMMSQDVANTSVHCQMWLYEAQAVSKQVIACPYLEVSRSYRTVDSYLVGGHITFTGCWEEYTLLGVTDYDCTQINDYEAEWSPYLDTECKSDEQIAKEKQQLAAAIATPICLLIVIAAVATGGFVYYRKQKKSKSPTETKNSGFSSPGKTNRDQQFENMADSASRSQSLASTNVSFGSIVLSETIQPARPLRPTSQHKPNWQEQQPSQPQNMYHNTSHVSQGSQLDLRVQPYPDVGGSQNNLARGQNNISRGSQNSLAGRQGYPNQYRGSQNDLIRAQGGSQNNLARGQNNISRGSQNSLAGRQGYPNQYRGSQNDLIRAQGYAMTPNHPGHVNQSFDNPNRSRGSQIDLSKAQGYSLPPSSSGHVNTSFNHDGQHFSQPSQNVRPPGSVMQQNGIGGENIAMADEDRDSSYEPGPGGLVNNSTGGTSV